jgi:hypothetical protein
MYGIRVTRSLAVAVLITLRSAPPARGHIGGWGHLAVALAVVVLVVAGALVLSCRRSKS